MAYTGLYTFFVFVYEIDCSDCQAVYFGESKWTLKSRWDEHKRSVRNCDCDKNEIAKHCWEADHNFNWDQKKVIDRESRLIPRKIKETIHFLKNPNHINKISYMFPEIWLPYLLIRTISVPPMRIRMDSQFSKFRWTFTKVKTMEDLSWLHFCNLSSISK